MNRNISNYYSKLIDDGAATGRDIYDALFAGIRSEDTILVEKSLSMLPPQANWDNDDYPYPTEFVINEMASNDIIKIFTTKGFSFDDYPPRLSLFNFTPKEMISFYKNNYQERGNPYEEIYIHITYYLNVYKSGYSCFRIPFHIDSDDEYKPYFSSYIDSWCCDFIDIVSTETSDEVKDRIISGFLQSSVMDVELKNLFIKAMEYLKGKMTQEYINQILNKAIIGGNEFAFFSLLSLADICNLSLSYYPRQNIKMLEKILSLGQLTPGTETGYKAFSDYVRFEELDIKILSRINHPSYSKKQDDNGQTPLMLAMGNENFPSSDYGLLISEKSDLEIKDKYGDTALLIAASVNPDVIEDLITLGADPTATNNSGNNVLHIMARKKEIFDIQCALRVLPLSLLEDKNLRGLTPLDVMRERITEEINYAL
ncbi:MAG: hypothetical protein PUC01_06515 [Spirochaetales bacterium]|nr:hypothetical protein [Spirochaetales bacterium]